MNLNHAISRALLVLGLILLNTINASAATGSAHLDSISGDSISGWAWDSGNPDNSVDIKITVTKAGSTSPIREISTTAAQHRPDLISAGKGDGDYGFEAVVRWAELETGIYYVQAYANGTEFPNSLSYNTETQETVQTSGRGIPAENLRPLGVFKTTAYCPCYSCSEGWGRQTSTGAVATAEHTIAVDPRVIPYGSKVMINGIVYTAEDRGGGVRGKHIDIFFNSHTETRQYGARSVEVYLVQ